MIKVTTSSETVYIIDEDNKQIKRIPRPGTTFESILRGFANIGEFQPYTEFDRDTLKIGGGLYVQYPNEQHWSYSSAIVEIEYEFEEENNGG